MLTNRRLENENLRYGGSEGVSQQNYCNGFSPAFCDLETGRIELSRYANGTLAPLHLIDGLPVEWVEKRDASGFVQAIKTSVVSGFLRSGCFYTRDEAVACSAV